MRWLQVRSSWTQTHRHRKAAVTAAPPPPVSSNGSRGSCLFQPSWASPSRIRSGIKGFCTPPLSPSTSSQMTSSRGWVCPRAPPTKLLTSLGGHESGGKYRPPDKLGCDIFSWIPLHPDYYFLYNIYTAPIPARETKSEPFPRHRFQDFSRRDQAAQSLGFSCDRKQK